MTDDSIAHEVNRQVSDEEQALWVALKDKIDRSMMTQVSVTKVAENHVGIHPTRSRQIVATWTNEGLVVSGQSDSFDQAALTEYGRQVHSIESTMTTGESWR